MSPLKELVQRFPTALQFSGGRDSLAMLYYLEDLWPDLTVYHVNSGDRYPETVKGVAEVARLVPNFIEVQAERLQAWPTDILPVQSPFDSLNLIGRYSCCAHHLMEPMHKRMVKDGIQIILRGQRLADREQSPVRSGQTIAGMLIIYPINHWSDEEVDDYLGDRLPAYYHEGLTSAPDCLHCTAWLEHGAVPYLRRHHPEVATEVDRRLIQIHSASATAFANLTETVHARN